MYYTIAGIYEDNGQRFCDILEAVDVRDAIRKTRKAHDGDLMIASVFKGQHEAVDRGQMCMDPF